MTAFALLRAAAALVMLAGPAAAEGPRAHEATLAGHAVLPARSFLDAPADAPAALRTAGRFAGPGRPDRLRGAAGRGDAPPFAGQPLQGFSGIRHLGGGRFLALSDNGFGTRANSADAMLHFSILRPDFATGGVAVERTVFLSDPDRVLPFPIAMEGSASRYLTGADLDPESIQPVGDDVVIGDEFGPYVVVADARSGVVRAFHETVIDGATLASPDHFALRNPDPGQPSRATLRRSRGFEGMALSPDGATLYPMLEGPLPRDGAVETVDGRAAARILEMQAQGRAWTGRFWLYPLEAEGHAIGDVQMLDATRALVIERDQGQGDAALACRDAAATGCFRRPARFKRVYLIDFAGLDTGAAARKIAFIDLLDIADPDGLARQGGRSDGRFAMPFVTIENLDRVDDRHILIANDNNFPFSRGRTVDAPDDSEFVLLEVGDFLRAR